MSSVYARIMPRTHVQRARGLTCYAISAHLTGLKYFLFTGSRKRSHVYFAKRKREREKERKREKTNCSSEGKRISLRPLAIVGAVHGDQTLFSNDDLTLGLVKEAFVHLWR